jgi:hypothetical protein
VTVPTTRSALGYNPVGPSHNAAHLLVLLVTPWAPKNALLQSINRGVACYARRHTISLRVPGVRLIVGADTPLAKRAPYMPGRTIDVPGRRHRENFKDRRAG